MPTRLFGIETEYAFAPLGPAGKTVPRERVLDLFFQVARERLCFLPGHGYDLHLANGSRLYLDCGLHPELCTPECANPWDVVRYVKAGEQILTEIAEEMARRSEGLGPIYLSKSNVDYSGAGTTWGCHESYLHRGDPETLPSQLIPFLVSRLVYTGSGGFDSRSGGLHFMVSPRVAHLCHTVSGDSTDDRGIFHTKDESLSACGYHRAHLLCSESLCSEQALWLRVGATALVVALIEAGVADGETVALRAPLEAMARFACDPTCTAEAEARDGRPLTALAIQHHYLDRAEAHLHQPWMPPWAPRVCGTWRQTLRSLERAPGAVATALDWAIRHALYDRRLRCRGFDPATLGHWNHVAQALDAAMTRKRLRRRPLSARLLLGPDSPVPRPVKHLGRYLSDHGLDWDGLDPFLALRAELFEIDSRFGQLGGQGIFDALDRCGVLSHHVEGVDNFAHAREHPPAEGRARVRGECVRKIADRGSPAVCCWSRIFDHRERRVLDLSDPLENSEHWEPLPEEAGPEADALARAVAAFERSRASARTPEGLHIGQRVVLADPADSGGPSDLHPGAQRLIGQSGVIVRVHRAAGTGETIAHVRTAEGTRHWWSHALRPAEPEAQAAAASQDGGTPC